MARIMDIFSGEKGCQNGAKIAKKLVLNSTNVLDNFVFKISQLAKNFLKIEKKIE